MELKELEGKLEIQQLERETKAAGVKVKTAKELEKEISERYSIEIRERRTGGESGRRSSRLKSTNWSGS